jgi:CRP/FNR family transcriptional regulator, polysaccharide utilization system transcription regulator
MQYPDKYIESCLEHKDSVFLRLSQKEKELIINHYSVSAFRKGNTICRQGEKFRGVIYLVSGRAKIYRPGVAGREHILKLIKPGDLMGLDIFFSDSRWSATSIALEDTIIITIERQCFLRLIRADAELAVKTGKLLSGALSESYDKMVSLTQKHVRGRLAESILMIAETYGYEADGRTLSGMLSRNDIAHLSNMTTSNAIRTLSSFAAEGLISIRRRQIAILDFPGLSRICDQA